MLKNQFTLVGNYNEVVRRTQISTNNYLIKQLPKATAFINTKFEIVYASDKWINDFNFTDRDIIGKTIYELFEHISEEWQNVLKNSLLGKPSEIGRERFLDDNKNERWFEWVNIPWYDDKENIIGVIVQTDDITQRIANRLELEKLELLLEEKSKIAKIGSWEYNLEKNELFWCNMTKIIHGVPMDYVPQINTAINFYKEGFSRNTIAMSVDNAIAHGTPWNEKLQLIPANGNEIWVIATGKPLYKNDKIVGLIGTFQDINQQTLSEIKTKEKEHLLRTLIDNLPLNVYIKDLESKKILANKSELECCGLKNENEILGKTDFDFFDHETAKRSREEDLNVMYSLNPILGKETINIKKDGTVTTFLTSKLPLKADNGEINGLIGISMDISNLKQKEEELRDLINVTSLQNKKLINFAHIISHNLRSHTANFSMLLDFLVNEKDEAEKNNIINMLVNASNNLLETLDNLNEVVAISTNTNLKKESVNLNDKITAVEQNLNSFLKDNNAKIINDISDEVYIKVIPSYIENILTSLITNAVKYKHPKRDPVVKLTSHRNGDHFVFSIEDNGLGIDLKKYGDKLFGMYKTFHNNPDARGIGLYITKNQIEAMNGKIVTCSKVGKGTTFNIYFDEKD